MAKKTAKPAKKPAKKPVPAPPPGMFVRGVCITCNGTKEMCGGCGEASNYCDGKCRTYDVGTIPCPDCGEGSEEDE